METTLKNYKNIVLKAVNLCNINIKKIISLHFYFDVKIISLYYLDGNNLKIKKDVLRKDDINYKYNDFLYFVPFNVFNNKEGFINFKELYKEAEEFLCNLNNIPFSNSYIKYITFYNNIVYLKFDDVNFLNNMEYKKEYLSVFKKTDYYYTFKNYPHLRIIADNYIEV